MSESNEKVYSRIFATIYDPFMKGLEKRELTKRRSRLLKQVTGEILEVGAGTGVNFPLYDKKANIKAIEPSPSMLEKATKKRDSINDREGNIQLYRAGMGDPPFESQIMDESLDAVVSTLVLCTIPEPALAIESFFRWLKPGGRLIILEHIRSHHNGEARMQDLVNPFWNRMAEGCQLNRPTDVMIKDVGFELEREDYFRLLIPFYEGVFRKPGEIQHFRSA